MAQYIDKSALVAEIERLKECNRKICAGDFDFLRKTYPEHYYSTEIYNSILSFLDTLEVIEIGVDLGDPKGDKSAEYIIDTKTLEAKEVQEETESIWHDANQQPTMYRKYLVRYSDGRVSGSWERHDNGFIPWKDVIKEHGFTHWCYVEDLIKL